MPEDADSIEELKVPASCQNRFQIQSVLTRGGMGVICIAWDRTCARQVAIKLLRGEFSRHAESNTRLIREAMVMSRLRHPGVPSVYDIGVDPDGRGWYAMQWIDGFELTEDIKKMFANRPQRLDRYCRPLRDLLRHVINVARTLQWAHEAGFLHRDIKPANIFVSRHRETVVLDWGLAGRCAIGEGEGENFEDSSVDLPAFQDSPAVNSEPLERAADFEELETIATTDGLDTPSAHRKHPAGLELALDSDLTQHLAKLGTPAYMAPEMRAGQFEHVDHRTDVYLLGATMFQILTNTPPFLTGQRSVSELRSELEKRPISRDLREICLKAMRVERNSRYDTANAFAEDLERYLADEPILAADETILRRVGRMGRRRWRIALTASTLLIVSTALLAVILISVQRTQRLQAENDLLDTRRQAARSDLENQLKQTEIAKLYQDVNSLDKLIREQPMGWSTSGRQQHRSLVERMGFEPTLIPRIRGQALAMGLSHDLINQTPDLTEQGWSNIKPGCFAYHRETDCLAIGQSKSSLYFGLKMGVWDESKRQWYPLASSSIIQGTTELFSEGMPPGYRALCFSASGNAIFVGTRSGDIYRYQIAAGFEPGRWDKVEPPRHILTGSDAINSITVSDDGNTLWALSSDRWVHVVDLNSAEQGRLEFVADDQPIVRQSGLTSRRSRTDQGDLRITADNRLIFGNQDGPFWDAYELSDLDGLSFDNALVSLHPDQQTLVVTGKNQDLSIVDPRSGEILEMIEGSTPLLGIAERHQAVSPDGGWLVRSQRWKQGNRMEVFDLAGGQRLATVSIAGELNPKLILTGDGSTIWLAAEDPQRHQIVPFESSIRRSPALARPIREILNVGGVLIAAAEDSTHLISKSENRISTLLESAFIRSAVAHSDDLRNLPTRFAMFANGPNHTVKLYAAAASSDVSQTGEARFDNTVEALAYDDRGTLWCAVEEKDYGLYQLFAVAPDGEILTTLKPDQQLDLNKIYSPTAIGIRGRIALVGLRTGAIDVFDLDSGRQIHQFWSGGASRFRWIGFQPTENNHPGLEPNLIVACLRRDGEFSLFRMEDDHRFEPLVLAAADDHPQSPIQTMQWINSRYFACGRADGSLEVYDVQRSVPTLVLSANLRKPCTAIHADDSRLTIHFEGERAVYFVPLEYFNELLTMVPQRSIAGNP